MSVRKTTQYRGDVVMFLLKNIIKNWIIGKKNVGSAHGFKTMYGGDVIMFFPNKIKNNKKYYMQP